MVNYSLKVNKLAKNLIEKGLNPRLKFCGVTSVKQVVKILEEFLPYCEIKEGVYEEDYFVISINFYTVVFPTKFMYSKKGNLMFIQKIVI